MYVTGCRDFMHNTGRQKCQEIRQNDQRIKFTSQTFYVESVVPAL